VRVRPGCGCRATPRTAFSTWATTPAALADPGAWERVVVAAGGALRAWAAGMPSWRGAVVVRAARPGVGVAFLTVTEIAEGDGALGGGAVVGGAGGVGRVGRLRSLATAAVAAGWPGRRVCFP